LGGDRTEKHLVSKLAGAGDIGVLTTHRNPGEREPPLSISDARLKIKSYQGGPRARRGWERTVMGR